MTFRLHVSILLRLFFSRMVARLIRMHIKIWMSLRKIKCIFIYLQLYKSLTIYLALEAVRSNHRLLRTFSNILYSYIVEISIGIIRQGLPQKKIRICYPSTVSVYEELP